MNKGVILTAMVFACASTPLLNRPAIADTASTTIHSSATVSPKCSFTQVNPLDFGFLQNLNAVTDINSTFQLRCTKQTVATIGINNGLHASGASGTTRAMKTAINNNYIDYEIYKDSGRTTVWNNNTSIVSYTATSSAPATFTLHGRIPKQPGANHGSFYDTITITATF